MTKEKALVPTSEGTQRYAKSSIRLCRKAVGQESVWQTLLFQQNLEHGEKYHSKAFVLPVGFFLGFMKKWLICIFQFKKNIAKQLWVTFYSSKDPAREYEDIVCPTYNVGQWQYVKKELRWCIQSVFQRKQRLRQAYT